MTQHANSYKCRRGAQPYPLSIALCPYAYIHYLQCDISPKAQSDETVPFTGKNHHLKLPQQFTDPDLRIGLSQIQQGYIKSMLVALL